MNHLMIPPFVIITPLLSFTCPQLNFILSIHKLSVSRNIISLCAPILVVNGYSQKTLHFLLPSLLPAALLCSTNTLSRHQHHELLFKNQYILTTTGHQSDICIWVREMCMLTLPLNLACSTYVYAHTLVCSLSAHVYVIQCHTMPYLPLWQRRLCF